MLKDEMQFLAGADWLYFGRVANHGPAPCKRGHRRNLSKRPIWTGPRRAGGRGVKAAPIGKHTGPHHDLAGRPRLHWHLSNNASPPLVTVHYNAYAEEEASGEIVSFDSTILRGKTKSFMQVFLSRFVIKILTLVYSQEGTRSSDSRIEHSYWHNENK